MHLSIHLNMDKLFIFEKQEEFVKDESKYKLMHGVAGSLKTLSLVLNVVYSVININNIDDKDIIIKNTKYGKINTIDIRKLDKHKFKNYHGCITTLTNSVTDEIKSRLQLYLNIDKYYQEGSHHIYYNQYISINISSMDGFIHTQLKSYHSEILEEKGDYFNSKVDELNKEIILNENRLSNIYTKKGEICTQVDVDEVQDMRKNRCMLLINICNNYNIKMNIYGDILQTIYSHSLDNSSPHPINKWKLEVGAKCFNTNICYRCPPSHLRLLSFIFNQPIYGDNESVYQAYNVQEALPYRTDEDVNMKPIMFTHPGTTKVNEYGDIIAEQIVNSIKTLMKLDKDINCGNISIMMKKSNENVIFYKIKSKLDKYYKDNKIPKTKIFATKDDGSHVSIDWSEVTDIENEQYKTIMISIHGIKGRDNKAIYFLGLSEKSLPMDMNLFKPEELIEISALDVALTRSTKYLFIGFNTILPSRYIKDIVDSKNHHNSIASNKLAVCSWKPNTCETEFQTEMVNSLMIPYRNALPDEERYPKPLNRLYITNMIDGPKDNIISISDITEEFTEPENHIDIRKEIIFRTNNKQVFNNVDDQCKPILGYMGELLYIREYYLNKYKHDIELFTQKIRNALRIINVFINNDKIHFTKYNLLLNIVKDNKLNSYTGEHVRSEYKKIYERYSDDKLKNEISDIINYDKTIVLPVQFNNSKFRKSIDEFISMKENYELTYPSIWNISLSYCILKDEIYKPCLPSWVNNPPFDDITVLLRNIHVIQQHLSIKELEYQVNHSLIIPNKDELTGLSGVSDVLDYDNDILYDIKTPLSEGNINGWISQVTTYLVTPVTGSTLINLYDYRNWNKTGIIDLTNGIVHNFTHDFQDKTKVDILEHILKVHKFKKDIIDKLIDKYYN